MNGVSLNIDNSLLEKIDAIDKNIDKLAKTADKTSKQIISAFKSISENGLNQYISKIKDAESAMSKLSGKKFTSGYFSNFKTDAQTAVDKVNQCVTLMDKINNQGAGNYRNSAITKINEEIEKSVKELSILQTKLNDVLSGKNRKVEYVDTAADQQKAKSLMWYIDALERERSSLQANARLKMTLAQNQQAMDNAWYAMEKKKREQDELSSKSAKKRSQEYQKAYEEQYKAYEQMFNKIQGKENSRRSSQSIYNEGTILYDNVFGKGGYKSIGNMQNAISQMAEAQKKLNLNTEDGKKKYAELGNLIDKANRELNQAIGKQEDFNKKTSSLLNTSQQLQRALALMFSVSQISNYMNKLVQVRKEMELQQKSLQVLLQSKDDADKLWNQTIDLAVRSPFRVKELVTYTRQLAAYRIETDKLHDTTKRLADVSAGLGVDMQRLILAFGQVRAANFLRGTELRQFTEAGIPMLDELAKYFTELEGKMVSAGDVFERISKRMVSFSDVEEVFRRMTDAGGTFYNMQEEQSKTLAGMISNLHDSIDLMLNDIGQANDGVLKGSVEITKKLVDNWRLLAKSIEGVLLSIAGYRLYQLATNKTMIRTAAAMKIVNSTGVTQLTMTQLLSVGWAKLTKSIGKASSTMASMLKFNLPFVIGAGVVSAVLKLYSAWNEHKKQLDEIDKKYDDLRKKIETVNVKFNLATDEKNIKEEKNKLNELVTIAKNDYNMKIKVDVEGMDEKEIIRNFNEISQQLFDANIFSAHFAKMMQRATEWVVEDDIFEDLEQLGNKANDVLHELSLNRERIVFDLQKSQDKLNESQREALEMLKQPKQIDESEVDYLERLLKGYSLVIDEYSAFQDALKNTKDASTASKLNVEFSKIKDTFKRLNIDAGSLYKLFNNYEKTIEEARVEFENFAKTLDLNENLTDEQKEIRLKTAIDKLALEKNWNDFVVNYIYRWTEKAFEIEFKPVIAEKEVLKDWQNTYNSMFKGFSGFKEITKTSTNQNEIIERINANIKETEEIINRINAAGGIKATMEGGAYSNYDLDELNKELKELKKQQAWFGESSEKNNKKNKDSIQEQISLIKEMHKEYNDLTKTFDKATSKEKVMVSYAEVFRDTFKEVGLSLEGKLLDQSKVDALRKTGEISEEVADKLNKLAESGTHIRNFTEDAVIALKRYEGFEENAYNIGDGRWTIGYGETQGVKQGDTITREVAEAKLRNRLTEDFVKSLNKVLDANKDIIITQEQYNALLDMTYQGGGGAVKRLFDYAKNEEKAVAHIQSIYEKVKKVIGENEAEKFGEAFVNKFKESENIYERISMLLTTMNLTVNGGKIDKKLYKNLSGRSQDRSDVFAYGKQLNDIFEKAFVDFSDLDITDAKGVVDFLEKLKPYAKERGEEAVKALNKAISQVKVDIGTEEQMANTQRISDRIEELFSGYDLSIELEKLNIPKDLASKLFNVKLFSIPELKQSVINEFVSGAKEGASAIKSELNKDFKSIDWKLVEKLTSKTQMGKIREFLQKVTNLENKEQEERLKKYTNYLLKAQSEHVRIKVEEMKQISEIESLKIGDAEKSLMIEGVKKEANKKLQKNALDEFQRTETYLTLYSDLENTSDKVLEALVVKLRELKTSLSDLPAEELKKLVSQIERAEEVLIKRNPFKALRDLKKQMEGIESEDVLSNKMISLATRREQTQKILDKEELKLLNLDPNSEQYKNTKLRINGLKVALNLTDEQIQGIKKLLNLYDQERDGYDAMKDAVNSYKQEIDKLFGSIENLMNALGVESDSMAFIILDAAKSMASLITSAIMFRAQLKAMKVEANAALGVIGWIAMAIEAIAMGISTLFKAHDNKLSKQLELQAKQVERLEKEFENLNNLIDKASSAILLKSYSDEAISNLKRQRVAYQQMYALEDDKKSSDEAKMEDYKDKMAELDKQILEQQQETINKARGNILDDVLSTANSFTDAWLNAFQETSDGMSGLKDNFREMMLDMVKQQASLTITSSYIEKWKAELGKYINADDLKLTANEAQKWVGSVTSTLPQLNEALENYFNAMSAAGISIGGGELSSLEKGIQSVTAAQAEAISSYLSSIRFFVSEQHTNVAKITDYMTNNELFNPIVSQLKNVVENIKAVHSLLESVRSTDGNSAYGIKVFMQ